MQEIISNCEFLTDKVNKTADYPPVEIFKPINQPEIKKAWKKGTKTLAIVYPNLYYGGVYCLAPLIIYNLVNNIPSWICERQFLDKHEDLSKFDLVGFTFQYELDSYNIQNLIKKYKPKITFAGGPCINQNPESLKNIDFFILVEAEEGRRYNEMRYKCRRVFIRSNVTVIEVHKVKVVKN